MFILYSINRYECGITNILYQGELGVWILAYRAISSVDLSFLVQNTFEAISKSCDEISIEEDSRQQAINNLIACSKLVTHNGSKMFSAPVLMKESLIAVFLLRCLQSRGYFGEENTFCGDSNFTDTQLKVAIWIHHMMRVAKFNSHEVTEYGMATQKNESGGVKEYFRYCI